jgi:hypothetical protein
MLPLFDIIGEVLPVDEARLKKLDRWENKNKCRLPAAIKQFFSLKSIDRVVTDTTPTNNYLPKIDSLEIFQAPDGDVRAERIVSLRCIF